MGAERRATTARRVRDIVRPAFDARSAGPPSATRCRVDAAALAARSPGPARAPTPAEPPRAPPVELASLSPLPCGLSWGSPGRTALVPDTTMVVTRGFLCARTAGSPHQKLAAHDAAVARIGVRAHVGGGRTGQQPVVRAGSRGRPRSSHFARRTAATIHDLLGFSSIHAGSHVFVVVVVVAFCCVI